MLKKGKKAQCCDDGCLDELALRECAEKCSSPAAQQPGAAADAACDYHKKQARRRYRASLDALGCICRALLARNLESCCDRTAAGGGRKSSGERGPAGRRGQASACEDACCAEKPGAGVTVGVDAVDVERGDAKNERVVLTVHGMTCTGCETKLQRSLAAIPSVSRVQTSLLLARAEFNVDSRVLSAEQVQTRLEKETGFNFDRVTNDDEELEIIEVLAGGDAKAFLTREMPAGVVGASVVDKETVALQYDPKIIGARDLVNHAFSSPLELAPLRPPPSISSGRKHVWNVGWKTLLSALLTIPVLIMAWAPLPENELAYGSASLALATIIQVVVAGPFYSSAVRSLVFSRVIEMDLLIVLSTSAAYIFSVVAFAHLVAGNPLSTGEFFETGTLLVTLIMVGRFLSAVARQKAVESVSVLSLQASTAILSSSDGQTAEEIDARLLQFGDIFKVLPETRIATDGTVISGSSEVDESMVTGEARLVPKESSSSVIAGSVNSSGVLLVRVSRLPGSNTISKIAAMVDEAKMSKPKIQDLADKIAGYFVPVVVSITIVTFAVWIGVGVGVRGQGGSEAAVQAITYAIATLIVSCPCAIGLAVPMVIVMASGIAAENGVVVKTAETLEVARKTSHVVLDKTGTLTQGKLSISREVFPNGSMDSAVGILFGLNSTNTVLFCGDGTNDSVALAQATVGLHMSGGTDVASSAADAVLTADSLSGLLVLLRISRSAFTRIVMNFGWSFVYNLFAILLAAGAFPNARIPPEFAGLGEVVSVLPVILIALQLKFIKNWS
ncbi:putative copper-translocating p-type atpase protein [Neofusicoccum parvum UCRNP2]|uniref:Putative copper-translocating P-type atpase protein n=1 Tax=Botryosphaeria parva (strain UCR-NP2) TaxID=1287680 RepID=R1GAC3_BOTPV|nr:putative copper-translocating p-type atpase protein [Neofusicoccum parvum UCRNP2]